jgi:hypothetical protein
MRFAAEMLGVMGCIGTILMVNPTIPTIRAKSSPIGIGPKKILIWKLNK